MRVITYTEASNSTQYPQHTTCHIIFAGGGGLEEQNLLRFVGAAETGGQAGKLSGVAVSGRRGRRRRCGALSTADTRWSAGEKRRASGALADG